MQYTRPMAEVVEIETGLILFTSDSLPDTPMPFSLKKAGEETSASTLSDTYINFYN